MPKTTEPEVGAFWSISMYDIEGNMVTNEIDRYSIGDRTAGLVRHADASLTIAIQPERPTDETVNWLPTNGEWTSHHGRAATASD